MKAFGILARKQDSFGIAVSGGSDSTALLLLAADYCAASGITCLAVTVDHGLRPEAAAEARKVRTLCGGLGIKHATLKWRREGVGQVSQERARLARHRLLAAWAQQVGVTRIALGHTRDDRIESFLIRSRQGSGWYGLAGPMPESCSPVWPEGRGLRLMRPLLAFGREELRDELRSRGVAWIDDPSNVNIRYERVRMRRLVDRIADESRDSIIRIVEGLTQFRAAVSADASALLEHLRIDEVRGGAEIPLLRLGRASEEARRRAVEALVMAAGGAERAPRRDALDRLLQRIVEGDPQLNGGVTLGGAKIRLRKGGLLSVSQAPARRGMPALGPPDWTRASALLAPPDLRVLAV
ncbi:MAG: tRNA lysidine(34) synthetase TilS [Hyphomonadaceae bacterium]